MYIAGLQVSHNQGIEALIAGSTAFLWLHHLTAVRSSASTASKSSGKVKFSGVPLLGRLVLPVHALATLAPPAAYIFGVATNDLFQPEWWSRYALPEDGVSLRTKALLRTFALVAFFAAERFSYSAIKHLGAQFAPIGVRDKPEVVTTGPYARVRHPVYTAVLIRSACFSIMTWSYIPLVAFGIQVASFIVKLPIEEGLMEEDEHIGAEYKVYKQRVPYRIIPYIW